MLTIRNAVATFIDETTESSGDLFLDQGVVVEPSRPNHGGSSTGAARDEPAVLDASGCVVTPGLVNAHHHLLQSAFRTLPGTRGVAMATWLPTMAAAYAAVGIDPELAYASARVGVAEGLLSGVTTVADHHLNWPAGASTAETVAIATATATAAIELGARLVFVRGSARDDAEAAAASAESIMNALVPNALQGIRSDGMLQVAIGPAGVHSDSRKTFALFGELAAKYGLRRRTQANEQVDVAIALDKYGRRPIDLLDEWGWLAPDVTLAHLCAVTDDEISRLAAAGVTGTHAPACDLPMGWGIAPVAALTAAGISMGLGTSGGGSNDAGHLLADARLAMQIAPLVGPPIAARHILGMATKGSALGLGRPELGSLALGDAADVCVWDVSGVADAAVADPVAGLLWANPGRRPKHVIVAGRIVVRDYHLVTTGGDPLDDRALATDLESLLSARRR
ncbi:amidohydrolase family protein [Subtercola lobariae]|uniref:Hydroxyatrazine ethylaminohydrolase n=1 Tax=Subtercola lobariae TaxID=1588641 RepID=A0A917F1A5_9MICO|nr:amidohydrolase family protein [Subtercola lobariae]GGF38395.1 hydroxyatrazine ethylaminohydrolase [Subtercola lobariae]